MSKKTNTDFLAAYIELDTVCNELLDTRHGGISEYINRLKESPARDVDNFTKKKLISYRAIRNRLAHEEGALKDIDEVTRSDIKWIKEFKKSIERRRDPISLLEKKTKSKRNTRLIFALAAFAIVAIAVIAAIVAFVV